MSRLLGAAQMAKVKCKVHWAMQAYYKQLKNTSVPTLERSLLAKSEEVWRTYFATKISWLNANGFPHAATRFIDASPRPRPSPDIYTCYIGAHSARRGKL